MFKDYFDIYVGTVSGQEELYKDDQHGNIEVLSGNGKKEKYIIYISLVESFVPNFPEKN